MVFDDDRLFPLGLRDGVPVLRQADLITHLPSAYPTGSDRGWTTIIKEPFAGAWQRNIFIDNTVTARY